jgi:hypothetical protein
MWMIKATSTSLRCSGRMSIWIASSHSSQQSIRRRSLNSFRIVNPASHINAYNALAMYGVVDAGVPNSLGGFTKFTFFYLRTFTIGGRSVSLYSFENDVIRPLGEERVHFVLNCMVVSCPRLTRTGLHGRSVGPSTRTAAHEFVNETRNVRVDAAARTVWLSAIFNFYTKDFFAHAPSLIGYLNRHRTDPIPQDFGVRYLDYDWTVNQVPAPGH